MSYYNNESRGEKQFHRSESLSAVSKRLVEMLDHLEERVELLREHATALESERGDLLSLLASVRSNKDLQYLSEGEREELEITTERLLNRTVSVQVQVTTPRNELQQKALNNVNKLYDDLIVIMESDLTNAKAVLQQYMNACLSDCGGPVNQKFQAAILECTADDQKLVRKKLAALMSSLVRNVGRT